MNQIDHFRKYNINIENPQNYSRLLGNLSNSELYYDRAKSQLSINNIDIPVNSSENNRAMSINELEEIFYNDNQRSKIKKKSEDYAKKKNKFYQTYDDKNIDLLNLYDDNLFKNKTCSISKIPSLPSISEVKTVSKKKKNLSDSSLSTKDSNDKSIFNYQKDYIVKIANTSSSDNIKKNICQDSTEKKKLTDKKKSWIWW